MKILDDPITKPTEGEEAPKAAETVGQEDARRTAPARVRTRKKGKVGGVLDGIAAEYDELNPGRKSRWIFAPENKPDVSNIMGRRAEGWRMVKASEIGDGTIPDLEKDEIVRISDVVLMSIDVESYAELVQEKRELAQAQIESVEREYYDKIMQESQKVPDRYRMTPRGEVTVEERLHEYEIEQPTGEDIS